MYGFTLDPTGFYAKQAKERGANPDIITENLRQACGIIPDWFANLEMGDTQGIDEIAKTSYGFPVDPIEKATLGDDKFYYYPEDPPLAPVAVIGNMLTGEELYIYPYGMIICVIQNGERNEDGEHIYKTISFRMD